MFRVGEVVQVVGPTWSGKNDFFGEVARITHIDDEGDYRLDLPREDWLPAFKASSLAYPTAEILKALKRCLE